MNEIYLDDYFTPREYQLPMINAFHKGYKRIISCQARRSGKDVTAFMCLIEAALQREGVYWYIWPNAEQGRKNAWNGKLNNGKPFLSLIPEEAIVKKNIATMMIELVSGSTIQIVGSERVDSLMGGNCCGFILTEYALADNQEAFELLLPMLRGNDGFCIILSTPRGRNSFYRLYQIAKDNPEDWFCQTLTVDDCKHISVDDINHDIETGIISWEKAQQEYWCNWDMGLDSTVYGSGMDRVRAQSRIGNVPYDGAYPVSTFWDIGRDMTSIVFAQFIGKEIRVIDYFEKPNENLEFFARKLQEYEYVFGTHFFPHDGKNIEWAGPKASRLYKAQQLGMNIDMVPRPRYIEDGIEAARSKIGLCWFDEKNCGQLIKCLENYSYKRDERLKVNSKEPRHDWASHGASAFMYMCMAVDMHLVNEGMDEEDADRIYKEAMYGNNQPHDRIFEKEYSHGQGRRTNTL